MGVTVPGIDIRVLTATHNPIHTTHNTPYPTIKSCSSKMDDSDLTEYSVVRM